MGSPETGYTHKHTTRTPPQTTTRRTTPYPLTTIEGGATTVRTTSRDKIQRGLTGYPSPSSNANTEGGGIHGVLAGQIPEQTQGGAG